MNNAKTIGTLKDEILFLPRVWDNHLYKRLNGFGVSAGVGHLDFKFMLFYLSASNCSYIISKTVLKKFLDKFNANITNGNGDERELQFIVPLEIMDKVSSKDIYVNGRISRVSIGASIDAFNETCSHEWKMRARGGYTGKSQMEINL